jgi:GT2 family glycosyltransferase
VTSLGCVVLSQGNRPEQLRLAVMSVLGQRDVDLDCVVVGNGWEPVDLPAGARAVALPCNIGIPAARNIGAMAVAGDVLLFLDDDAELVGDGMVADVVARFDADPSLAVLQPRAIDPDGAATARRHVPRLRAGDPGRPGDVAWFWEGCSFLRRTALDAAGGWPGEFFYGHEGIEVAWRVIDAGQRVSYAADLQVRNPEAPPFRGEQHRYFDARNRVWVARRNLPVPLLAAYLALWVSGTLLRTRSGAAVRAALRGFLDGARLPAGPRRPIRWRTAWRLTRLGRPPVI